MSSKKIRTLQEEAYFYLSRIETKDRYWWQSISPDRMREKIKLFINSDDVKESTKQKLLAVNEQL